MTIQYNSPSSSAAQIGGIHGSTHISDGEQITNDPEYSTTNDPEYSTKAYNVSLQCEITHERILYD